MGGHGRDAVLAYMHAVRGDYDVALDLLATLEGGGARKGVDILDATGRAQDGWRALELGANGAALQLFVEVDTVAEEPGLGSRLAVCQCRPKEK